MPGRREPNDDAMKLPVPAKGKFTDWSFEVPVIGTVKLGPVLAQNNETGLYLTGDPNLVVKLFDLDCGKEDEFSYGPYVSYMLEMANFDYLLRIDELKPFVPAFHGGQIDYERKFSWIAMEFLDGQDLKSFCQNALQTGFEGEWLEEYKRIWYEALSIVHLFHKHGIILIDFKPENVLRLKNRMVKFVDLGAWFNPKHREDIENFGYAATPDHAEVMIDASNLATGVPPTEASDLFSFGVALFEMATGTSRLTIDGHTADEILSTPEVYLFRDSQIKDVWRIYPHLKSLLPLVQSQLHERLILFADLWHLLKAYVARKVPDWDTLAHEQQEQIILATGTTFIMEQLPHQLKWLAGPIAQTTILRSLRLKAARDLMQLMATPVSDQVLEDVREHNVFVNYLKGLDQSVEFVERLCTWDVRLNRKNGQWAIAAILAWRQFAHSAQLVFLHQTNQDEQGHKYWMVVDELEADDYGDDKATLWHLRNDHFSWLSS